jgi:hypothetical protein
VTWSFIDNHHLRSKYFCSYRTQQKRLDGAGFPRSLGKIADIHSRSMSSLALQPRSDDGHPLGQDAYLTPLLNTEVIPLEAVEAYQIFHDGSPKKFVIDPHNMAKLMSTG